MKKRELDYDFDNTVFAFEFGSNEVICYSYNSDADSGAQWVEDNLYFDMILEADEKAGENTNDIGGFWDRLDDMALQYCYDWYQDGYDSYRNVFEDNWILPRDENTRKILVNYAKQNTGKPLKQPKHCTILYDLDPDKNVFIQAENGNLEWITYEEDGCDGPIMYHGIVTQENVNNAKRSNNFWTALNDGMKWKYEYAMEDLEKYNEYANLFDMHNGVEENEKGKKVVVDYFAKKAVS